MKSSWECLKVKIENSQELLKTSGKKENLRKKRIFTQNQFLTKLMQFFDVTQKEIIVVTLNYDKIFI